MHNTVKVTNAQGTAIIGKGAVDAQGARSTDLPWRDNVGRRAGMAVLNASRNVATLCR